MRQGSIALTVNGRAKNLNFQILQVRDLWTLKNDGILHVISNQTIVVSVCGGMIGFHLRNYYFHS